MVKLGVVFDDTEAFVGVSTEAAIGVADVDVRSLGLVHIG